jgi:dTDP-4-amino-4,6-dideoxygalactose transaminase
VERVTAGGGDAPEIPIARPFFGEAEEKAVAEVLRSGWVAQGPRVAEFEERFAERVGAREAVAVSSCTAGLFLSLHALGVGPGDEVVVPSLSFIATANVALHAGATPVFADVEPGTYNLDPAAVEAAITPRTRAVIAAHQLGLPADLDAIAAVTEARGIPLVEDAACAVGSAYKGRPIGSSDRLACFSFHARKLLVTGEGGMITTADAELAARLRRLRHHGMSVSDLERHRSKTVVIEAYGEVGFNFRMSDLQAAVGVAQLARLEEFLARRREIASRYGRALAELPGVVAPGAPGWATPNHQSYMIRMPGADAAERDRVLDVMWSRGVAVRRGVMAAHLEPCYRGAAASLPETEHAASQTLLLPIFHGLSDGQQETVVEALAEALP